MNQQRICNTKFRCVEIVFKLPNCYPAGLLFYVGDDHSKSHVWDLLIMITYIAGDNQTSDWNQLVAHCNQAKQLKKKKMIEKELFHLRHASGKHVGTCFFYKFITWNAFTKIKQQNTLHLAWFLMILMLFETWSCCRRLDMQAWRNMIAFWELECLRAECLWPKVVEWKSTPMYEVGDLYRHWLL